jgi:hypothetical protein
MPPPPSAPQKDETIVQAPPAQCRKSGTGRSLGGRRDSRNGKPE